MRRGQRPNAPSLEAQAQELVSRALGLISLNLHLVPQTLLDLIL